MRPNAFALLAGAAALVHAQDLTDEEFQEPTEPTTFNQVKVPLLVELTPSNWNDEINKTRWMLVKHYRCVARRAPTRCFFSACFSC